MKTTKTIVDLDAYHAFAVERIASAMHVTPSDIVVQAVREWIGSNYHLLRDARATLTDWQKTRGDKR